MNTNNDRLKELAKILHSHMEFCYMKGSSGLANNQPWPDKLPGDFGYVPQPWVDVALAQARAVIMFETQARLTMIAEMEELLKKYLPTREQWCEQALINIQAMRRRYEQG